MHYINCIKEWNKEIKYCKKNMNTSKKQFRSPFDYDNDKKEKLLFVYEGKK